MAQRLNKVIELLEQGKVVFGGGMAWTGNIDEAMAFADLGYDFVIFEMEHEGFRTIISGPTRIDRTLEISKKAVGR